MCKQTHPAEKCRIFSATPWWCWRSSRSAAGRRFGTPSSWTLPPLQSVSLKPEAQADIKLACNAPENNLLQLQCSLHSPHEQQAIAAQACGQISTASLTGHVTSQGRTLQPKSRPQHQQRKGYHSSWCHAASMWPWIYSRGSVNTTAPWNSDDTSFYSLCALFFHDTFHHALVVPDVMLGRFKYFVLMMPTLKATESAHGSNTLNLWWQATEPEKVFKKTVFLLFFFPFSMIRSTNHTIIVFFCFNSPLSSQTAPMHKALCNDELLTR